MKRNELRVFHLDDEEWFLKAVKNSLVSAPAALRTTFLVESFQDIESMLASEARPDIILLDYQLDKSSFEAKTGVDAAKDCSAQWPNAVCILLTSMDEEVIRERALSHGSHIHDFLPKDVALPSLPNLVSSIYKVASARFGLRGQQSQPLRTPPVLSGRTLLEYVKLFSPLVSGGASLLIEGDAGTGKTALAQALLCYVPKKEKVIHFNCADTPSSAIKRALQELSKKAESGEPAGWVVLENISDLSVALQNLLTKVESARAPDMSQRHLYPKLLATCQMSAQAHIEDGVLSESLVSVFETTIKIPPLYERPDEIEDLVNHWIQRYSLGVPLTIVKPAMDCLKAYTWHNENVRELFSCLKSMSNVRFGTLITPISLPSHVREAKKMRPHMVSRRTDKTVSLQFDPTLQRPFNSYFFDLTSQVIRLTVHSYHQAGFKPTIRGLAKKLQISHVTLSKYLSTVERLQLMPKEEIDELRK